jgi:hypothetical protein
MSRGFLSVSLLILLAGCASAPRPQLMVAPHHAPIVKAAPAPAVAAAVAPAKPTFKERFRKFTGRLKWVHH